MTSCYADASTMVAQSPSTREVTPVPSLAFCPPENVPSVTILRSAFYIDDLKAFLKPPYGLFYKQHKSRFLKSDST